jgi:hypothetical protein
MPPAERGRSSRLCQRDLLLRLLLLPARLLHVQLLLPDRRQPERRDRRQMLLTRDE